MSGKFSYRGDSSHRRVNKRRHNLLHNRYLNKDPEPPTYGATTQFTTQNFGDGSKLKNLRIVSRTSGKERLFTSRLIAPTRPSTTVESATVRHVRPITGISILPRTDAAPYGYGFPRKNAEGDPINPPFGTPGGPFRTVLINKLRDDARFTDLAKYEWLGSVQYWGWTYRIARDLQDGTPLPPFQQFWLPGMHLDLGGGNGAGFLRQFEWPEDATALWTRRDGYPFNTQSKVVEDWQTHWVQEGTYATAAEREMFRLVNLIRASVDRPAVYSPPDGFVNPAQIAVDCMAISQGWGHDIPDNPQGFQKVEERVAFASTPLAGGENVAFVGKHAAWNGKTEEEKAAFFTEMYFNSPNHYENMISQWWNSVSIDDLPDTEIARRSADLGTGSVLWLGYTDTVKPIEKDWYTNGFDAEPVVIDPAWNGHLNAQVFYRAQTTHYTSGPYTWKHPEYGTVSWWLDQGSLMSDTLYMKPMHTYYVDTLEVYQPDPMPITRSVGLVSFRGSQYRVSEVGSVLGAALYRDSVTSELVMRMAIMDVVNYRILIVDRYISELHDRYGSGSDYIIGEYPVGAASAAAFGQARFSEDATKMVVKMEWFDHSRKIVNCLDAYRVNDGNHAFLPFEELSGDNYPAEYTPRVPRSAAFVYWNRDGGFSTEGVSGITHTGVCKTETELRPFVPATTDGCPGGGYVTEYKVWLDEYSWTATGSAPLYKDYVGNDLKTVMVSVDDAVTFKRESYSSLCDEEGFEDRGVAGPLANTRTMHINRQIEMPTGQTLVHYSHDSVHNQTTAPSHRACINHLDVATGDISGYKITFDRDYVTEWTTAIGNFNVTLDFFFGNEVLATISYPGYRSPEIVRTLHGTGRTAYGINDLAWAHPSQFEETEAFLTYRWYATADIYLNLPPNTGIYHHVGEPVVAATFYPFTDWQIDYGQKQPEYGALRVDTIRHGSYVPSNPAVAADLRTLQSYNAAFNPNPESTGGLCDIRKLWYDGEWVLFLDHGYIPISNRYEDTMILPREHNTHQSSLDFSALVGAELKPDISPVQVFDELRYYTLEDS